MPRIEVLSNETIDKIAAGEVVERPVNVVKELVENAIDAKATAITVEIKGGGIDLIRITDNGTGIEREGCKTAFLRHATSKIHSIDDLDTLVSLGFRGEALSSICAVSKTEMITKTSDTLLGSHLVVEGGKLMENSEIGAPKGTTMIVRHLFYNTPARKKFLKTPVAEAATIEDLVQKLALSHPDISFQLILNGKNKLSTSGSGELKDVIYNIFGKDVYDSLLPVKYDNADIHIEGYTAKPEFSYQARNGELYFVNGRFITSKVVRIAIEQVYSHYLMQHRFPFCVLKMELPGNSIDINVHPQKMEVKFDNNELISECIINALNDAFKQKELIPTVTIEPNKEDVIKAHKIDDTHVTNLSEALIPIIEEVTSEKDINSNSFIEQTPPKTIREEKRPEIFETKRFSEITYEKAPVFEQESLFEKKLISDAALKEYTIIGQVFDTYWLISLNDDLYIVDQHAAHEKVNYERFVKLYNDIENAPGQIINPPLLFHLSAKEHVCLMEYLHIFEKIGYEIEDFGQDSIAVRAVPLNLYGSEEEELFHRLLNELLEKDIAFSPTVVLEKLASMSCKAAIKGNQRISSYEMNNLMKQLMSLENPYNCPHGRPVFIRITKNELEKKFKRIV